MFTFGHFFFSVVHCNFPFIRLTRFMEADLFVICLFIFIFCLFQIPDSKNKEMCWQIADFNHVFFFSLFGEHTLGIQLKRPEIIQTAGIVEKKPQQFSIVIWTTLLKCHSSWLTWCVRMWSVETRIWSELSLFNYIKWLILLWSVFHFSFDATNLLLVCLKSHSRGHPNLTISQSNATCSNMFPSTLNYLSVG